MTTLLNGDEKISLNLYLFIKHLEEFQGRFRVQNFHIWIFL